jgi:plastocyanin
MRNLVCPPAALLAGLVLTPLFAPAARAQQFQQVTPLPTIAGATARWTEGIECADVDHDGDLDVFLAQGDGFSSAGTKRQNGLVINKLVEIGAWNLVDESVLRLGAHVSNAKQVTTGDVNGDGWVDVLFANCFNTDTPFLYINRGNAQPGFFDMESATRGLTTVLSSGGACFADLDNDGDLDVIIADAYFASGKPRLYFNDGTGVFTENAAALGAPIKNSQQDVQFADVDGDWDLDFIGFNRAANANGTHYLMLNDGSGNFTDASATLGTTSSNVYEGEIGDLDGDNDVDLFLVSLSGFAEGAIRNNVVPSTSLTFTQQAGLGGDDDNEIALIDYDNDGDYDALVGSLGAASEKIYQNNGNFSFALVAAVQAQSDSTLDCTIGDLNNDGAYELLTAQGESGTFVDKYYRNTGSADTIPPVITGVQAPLAASPAGPTVVRAKVRDQVLDDGVNYVTGEARYVVLTAASNTPVTIGSTGGFAPSSVNVQAGTTVTWTNTSASPQRVASTTSPFQYDSGPIAPGGTYSHTFVSTGNYGYFNSLAGTSGSVAVAGSVTIVAATYSGGQIYRFRMNDTAGGAGVQLCYELRFRDWPGNVRMSDSGCIPLTGGPLGTAFCFGDGTTSTICPCFNTGLTGRGCENSAATGGASLSGSGTVSPDTVVLTTSNELPTVLSIFLQGDVNNSTGVVFGDGVRCVAGNLKRIGVKNAVGGSATYPGPGDPSISAQSATLGDPITPGTSRYYQVYYRDPDLTFCPGQAFNVSGGLRIDW